MTETPVYPNRKPRTPKPAVAVPLVVGIILLFLFVMYACVPYLESGNHVTYPPPGGQPERFDPFTAIGAIQTQIGAGAELVEIRAMYVKSDGTQDLMNDAYFAQADYTFVKEVPAPEDAPPVGAGGSATGRWYQRFDVDILYINYLSSIYSSQFSGVVPCRVLHPLKTKTPAGQTRRVSYCSSKMPNGKALRTLLHGGTKNG